MYPTIQTFSTIIKILLKTAEAYNEPYLDINAGRLHRFVGGYPSPNHRMPNCNSAMRQVMQEGDDILIQPQKRIGASLTIRYFLPRL